MLARLTYERLDLGSFEGDRGALGIVLVVGVGVARGRDDRVEVGAEVRQARERLTALRLQPFARLLHVVDGNSMAPVSETRLSGRVIEELRTLALVAATMTMGLMAGYFALYAHTIMPGLGTTDDRTFVGSFQALDRAIINPWFMASGFLGSLAFTALVVALSLGSDVRRLLPWVVAALVLYLVAFVITIAVHLPLNDALKAAGSPDRIADLGQVRQAFDEARWVRWNVVRTLTTTAALGCLAWSLFLQGRLSA